MVLRGNAFGLVLGKIFISHSSANNAEALAMHDWLAGHGWDDVFLDLDPRRGLVAGDRWPLIDHRNGAWYGGRVRAVEWLAELVEPDTRVMPTDGPILTGRDIVRQRNIYLELFETLIGYMNRGFGPEDAARENPLGEYEGEFGDGREFLYGAYRSMLIAYVPD